MSAYLLQAVDSLFFGGPAPFFIDDAQALVASTFPPPASQVVGALRAAFARSQGWPGHGRWKRELNTTLGDGPKDLGALSFTGPFVVRKGEAFFPMPRHVMGRGTPWTPEVLLRPGQPVLCDLGEGVRLPTLPETVKAPQELKPAEDVWVNQAGLGALLRGALPSSKDCKQRNKLWEPEVHVGIERDATTHAVAEGKLYSTTHVRPCADVAVGVEVSGLPEGWGLKDDLLLPFGGEARAAALKTWDTPPSFQVDRAAIERSGEVALVAITPLELSAAFASGQQALGGLEVVSACLPRTERVGGWDSKENKPTPLAHLLPAGSVLFCTVTDAAVFWKQLGEEGLVALGERTAWGHGRVALGVWPATHH